MEVLTSPKGKLFLLEIVPWPLFHPIVWSIADAPRGGDLRRCQDKISISITNRKYHFIEQNFEI